MSPCTLARIGAWTLGLGLLAGCGAGVASPSPSSSTATPVAASATPTAAGGAPVSGTFTIGTPSTATYTAHETFLARNSPFTPVGKTPNVSGTLVLANGRFQGSTVRVGLTALKTDNAMRDRRVQQTLDTARHPDATFAVTGESAASPAVTMAGPVQVQLRGNMTVDGTTKPVVWSATVDVVGQRLHLQASTDLQMTLFGVTPPSVAGFVAVQDGIQLATDLSATRG